MRKAIVIAVAAAAITGCSVEAKGQADPKPEPSSASAHAKPAKPTPHAADLSDSQRRSVYLGLAHRKFPVSRIVLDGKLVALAHSTCDALDNGVRPAQVVRLVIRSANGTMTVRDLAGIVGLGIGVYCPEHASEFGGQSA